MEEIISLWNQTQDKTKFLALLETNPTINKLSASEWRRQMRLLLPVVIPDFSVKELLGTLLEDAGNVHYSLETSHSQVAGATVDMDRIRSTDGYIEDDEEKRGTLPNLLRKIREDIGSAVDGSADALEELNSLIDSLQIAEASLV